eukprot:scaffold311396_cov40-Tisochrysis_lutea.AAC.1
MVVCEVVRAMLAHQSQSRLSVACPCQRHMRSVPAVVFQCHATPLIPRYEYSASSRPNGTRHRETPRGCSLADGLPPAR